METQNQIKILPTFGGSHGHGWKTMFDYFLVLLLVVIVMGIVMFPAQLIKINIDADSFHEWKNEFDFIGPATFAAFGVLAVFLGILALIYAILVIPVFKYGANIMFVHAARGVRPEFESLIKGFKENYLHIILASLLTIALVIMGTFLLIVPGIIVACRLAFVSYLVMDRKLDPIIAVEESWRLTRGYGWTIFAMGLVSFFIFILGLAMLFIGIIPAIMWVKSSFASLYEAVLTEQNGAVAVTE